MNSLQNGVKHCEAYILLFYVDFDIIKKMLLMKGNSIAQLKPVTVIGNEMQRRFFFRLVEDFEEIKAISALR